MREDKGTQTLNINISVENFGPIEKADIDLRPLTIFVGESNTGKTYLATLIYALDRAFEGISRVPIPESIILLLRQSRFRHKEGLDDETYDMLTKLNTLDRVFRYADLPEWICKHVLKIINESDVVTNQLKESYNLKSITDIRRFTKNNLSVSLEVYDKNQFFWNFKLQNSGTYTQVNGNVNPDLVIKSSLQEVENNIDLDDFGSLLRFPKYSESNSYFLPASQIGIMETHGIITSSLVDRATDVNMEHTSDKSTLTRILADFLKHIINYENHKTASSEIVEIAKELENEVLRGEIKVLRPAGIGYPQILYQPLNTEHALRMSQSSSMVTGLAPLVLFLRGVVKPGDTLIIEEPESHLHPGAQTQVAITLAKLVRAGVRVIITTHSEWLLEQISNLVRMGELKKKGENQSELDYWLTADEVGTWWFHADRPVVEIPFDRIEGIEPKDYEDVADGLYNTFVELERQFLKEEAVTDNE